MRPQVAASNSQPNRTELRVKAAAMMGDLVAGIIQACCFAPWPPSFPPWLPGLMQILTLAWLARRTFLAPNPSSAFWRGLTFGFGGFGAGIGWVYISLHVYAELPAALALSATAILALGLALGPAAASWLCRTLYPASPPHGTRWAQGLQAIACFAGAWTVFEGVRGYAFTGFPWLAVGYGQMDSPLAGWAPVLGVYGVGGATVLVASALAWSLTARVRWPVALAQLVVVCGWTLQQIEWVQPQGQPMSVRLLQGNIRQDMKFDPELALSAIDRYAQLTEAGQATLTVLPETAWVLPWLAAPDAARERLLTLAQQRKTWIALGIPLPVADPWKVAMLSLEDGVTNSVVLLGPQSGQRAQFSGRYDKRHLVPFGEFIPLGFHWFVDMMVMPMGDFARGPADPAPLAVADQQIAFNICYEDLFGEELTGRVELGATILINVSNIAWFGGSHALPQHLQISRMRSLELGRPMLRATNTGVTAAIDHRGRVLTQLPIEQEGALDTKSQGMRGLTPYARFGNRVCMGLSLLILLGAVWQNRRVRSRAP